MQLPVRIVVTHMQGADTDAAAMWRRPSEDNQLLSPTALYLDPGWPATGPIGSLRLFADDPFKMHLACIVPHRMRVAGYVIAVFQHSCPVDRALQQPFALKQGCPPQIPAI